MALRGTFRETNPEDLLQILALGGKTGVLTTADGPRATKLIFRDGEIFDAFDGIHRGEAAVWALLASRTGSFVFAPGDIVCERTIQRTVPAILLEAARRRDEQWSVEEVRWRPDVRPQRFRGAGVAEPEAMTERQRQVLEMVDGRRTVAQLADAAGLPPGETGRVLVALEVLGHVTPAAGDAQTLPAEWDESANPACLGAVARQEAEVPAGAEDLREIAHFVRGAVYPPSAEGSPEP